MRTRRPTGQGPASAPASRVAIALALAAALTACDAPVPAGGIAARAHALEHPNVVLVVVDTLRADRTTPYGAPADVSPEMARWAAHGVIFERALAQSSWTKVSMASLMTSLWPRSHGIRETTDALGAGADTLAERFREGGYRTYAVQSNGWLEQTFGFHQGFERYSFPRGGLGPGHKPMIWPHADNVYREAARLLDVHDGGEPFLLYLHFMDVHEYAAPPDLQHFGSDAEGAYAASIAWVDEVLERLRARLADDGLLDRTLLVLASDHGEAFGENGVHGHARNALSAALHVPLILRLPFPVEPVRIRAQVRNLDLAPTLLDLAGLPVPDAWEGRSLLPLLGRADAEDRESFASLPALLYRDAVLQDSLTDGAWMFARDRAGERAESLYDRRVDPHENVDLIEIETAEAARLRQRLAAHLAQPAAADTVESKVRIDPSLAQKLRALGYLR